MIMNLSSLSNGADLFLTFIAVIEGNAGKQHRSDPGVPGTVFPPWEQRLAAECRMSRSIKLLSDFGGIL